jgi:hypothetical protein
LAELETGKQAALKALHEQEETQRRKHVRARRFAAALRATIRSRTKTTPYTMAALPSDEENFDDNTDYLDAVDDHDAGEGIAPSSSTKHTSIVAASSRPQHARGNRPAWSLTQQQVPQFHTM